MTPLETPQVFKKEEAFINAYRMCSIKPVGHGFFEGRERHTTVTVTAPVL